MDIRPDVQYTPSDCLKTELEDVWCSLINYTLYMHADIMYTCMMYDTMDRKSDGLKQGEPGTLRKLGIEVWG